MYGYGYRLGGFVNGGADSVGVDGEGFNAKLGDEMYVCSWHKQSLSPMALIEDGDDE